MPTALATVDRDRLRAGGGVLDGEPLVIARGWCSPPRSCSRSPRGSSVQAHRCLPWIASCVHRPHGRSQSTSRARPILAPLEVISAETDCEVPVPIGIDIPEHLAQRIDRQLKFWRCLRYTPAVMLTVAPLAEIGDREVLLEMATGVALGKEPVTGQLLHPDHIGATRDDARIATVDATEVGGPLAHHRLAGGEHHRDARGQVR